MTGVWVRSGEARSKPFWVLGEQIRVQVSVCKGWATPSSQCRVDREGQVCAGDLILFPLQVYPAQPSEDPGQRAMNHG